MKKTLFLLGTALILIFAGCNKPKITCEIVKPLPNAVFELGETIDLAVDVAVENTNIYEVQIYLDGVGYDKKISFPFNFRIYPESLKEGSHTIRVVAFGSDNVTDESTVTFSVVKYEAPNFVSFSDGKLPKGWSANYWSITSPGFDDNFSIRSESYGYNYALTTIKTCDATIDSIEFYAKGVSYYYMPRMRFLINNIQHEIQLTESWQRYAFAVPSGEHTFTWYPYNLDSYSDYICLDAIKFYKK
ncbi:MAG: Ig-like domain-containing protein [Lentimicrobiaceae bacterium]|nr:Ig-like domain-containing protein [Lentimicrobiaceae bacterium]